jgi:nitroreductase
MNETLDLLAARRSVAPVALSGPGPDAAELETLLRIASRVPDHGKLAPWRFIVFQGEARERAGDIVARAFAQKEPDAGEVRFAAERKRMTMAPLIVGVVSRAAAHGKIPLWEQEMSVGAVCMNMLIAAHAMGYAGCWLTNWFSYDADVLAQFGVAADERMAGFVHIGRAVTKPDDRPRPPLSDIVTYFPAGDIR